jgi:hypothetical protein
MDALAIILRTIRETIESTGVPPDRLQDGLAEAERRVRRSLGGGVHHISRAPQEPTKERIAQLARQGLPSSVVAERVGVSDRYVRRILQQLRQVGGPN